MKRKPATEISDSSAALRKRAEEKLAAQQFVEPAEGDIDRALHELRVHQIELEMQNEELCRAQLDLETSRARYFDLYELAPVGYFTLSEDGLIQQVNLTAAGLLGVERNGLIHRPLTQFILREDQDVYYMRRKQLLETGARQVCEFRLLRKGGEPFWARAEAITAHDNDGSQVCRVVLSDITDRKRQTEEIRSSEEKFRTLALLAPAGIYLTTPDGRCSYANACWLEQAGLSLEEALGDGWVKGLHPEDRAAVFANWQKVVESSGKWGMEYRFMTPGGKITWVYGLASPQRDSSGRVTGYVGINTDITERKVTEDALRISESRYQIAERVADLGHFALNLKTGKGFWSGGARRVLGAQAGTVLAGMEDFLALVHPEDRAQLRHAMAEALRNVVALETEYRILLSDGGIRHVHTRAIPVGDEMGGYTTLSGVLQDITERKKAQQWILEFSHDLLVAREEEKKRLAAVLHHDVGSMAVGLSARFDAVEEEIRAGKVQTAFRWMKQVRKVFDASVDKLRNVAADVRPPELDVLGLSAALRQHFSTVTMRGKIRIKFSGSLKREVVSGDVATILFRVAQESLTNAIRHGHAKVVDVRLCKVDNEVRLTVRDDGRGFDSARRRGGAGLHMGLRTMREMVDSAAGKFEIESRRGKGTTVRVKLPVGKSEVGSRASIGEDVEVKTQGSRQRIDRFRT